MRGFQHIICLEGEFLEQPGGSTRPSVGQRDEAKKESSLHLGSNCHASVQVLELFNFSIKEQYLGSRCPPGKLNLGEAHLKRTTDCYHHQIWQGH